MVIHKKLLSAVDEAMLLSYFKAFCDGNTDDVAKQRLRNILARATNKENAIRALFFNMMQIELSEEQSQRMVELVCANLRKSNYRKNIPEEKKRQLLMKQSNRCNFCGCEIGLCAHSDHIIPFKYVGDELQDNLQMLCSRCNLSKGSSIDYQIKVLLNLTKEGLK